MRVPRVNWRNPEISIAVNDVISAARTHPTALSIRQSSSRPEMREI